MSGGEGIIRTTVCETIPGGMAPPAGECCPAGHKGRKYHDDKGLEILDIPCNQFGGQAPGTDEEIHEFCTLHFNTTFPQMKKADVEACVKALL